LSLGRAFEEEVRMEVLKEGGSEVDPNMGGYSGYEGGKKKMRTKERKEEE